MTPDFNRKLYSLLAVILGQALLNVIVLNLEVGKRVFLIEYLTIPPVVVFLSLGMSILAIGFSHELVRLADKEKESEINAFLLEQEKELNSVLRAHKHDFINHLQIISGLIQLNKEKETLEYIINLGQELRYGKQDQWVHKPEIDAMLYNKALIAKEKKIQCQINCEVDFKNVSVPSIDVARILGNLMDNALHACETLAEEKRYVAVRISVEAGQMVLKVFNRWPVIPKVLQEAIFQKGFTTKGTEGNGLGLWIVDGLVKKHQGTLVVNSDEDYGTEFVARIPCHSAKGNTETSKTA